MYSQGPVICLYSARGGDKRPDIWYNRPIKERTATSVISDTAGHNADRKGGHTMGLLERFRRIMAADKTASRRGKAGLMGNSLWDGVYDRSGTPKDSRGAINKEELRRDRER